MLDSRPDEGTAGDPRDGRQQVPSGASRAPASPGSGVAVPEALSAFAEAAVALSRQHSPQALMEQLVAEALRLLPGCDEVGVVVVRSDGRLDAPAATGKLAAQAGQLQCTYREGPAVDVSNTDQIVRVDDLGSEQRWPKFSPDALALDVHSMLAVPLSAPRNVKGALALYARTTGAFDDPQIEPVATAFATHAAIAIMHAELEDNLRLGLTSREEVGRAVGILMERHRLTAGAAFDRLVVTSQRTHRKVRDVARWVNDTGEDPEAMAP